MRARVCLCVCVYELGFRDVLASASACLLRDGGGVMLLRVVV